MDEIIVMATEPKVLLQELLQLLGFTATVEEHELEEGIFLEVKTEDTGRLTSALPRS